MSRTLAADVRSLAWAAEQLGIGVSTAYRLAPTGYCGRAGVGDQPVGGGAILPRRPQTPPLAR